MRVLVADDGREFRERLVRYLNGRPGLVVVGQAGDGRETLQAMACLRPDVVLLDLRMPEVDGFAVLRAFEGHGTAVKFVVVSAHGDVLRARCLAAGASAVVDKRSILAELLPALHGLARTVES